MRRRLTSAVIGCLSLLAAGCYSVAPSSIASDQVAASQQVGCAAPADAKRLSDQVLQLVNLERASVGLAPVVSNSSLTEMAEDYACRMIENDFFAHEDPTNGFGPAERAIEVDYAFFAIGENLAAGQQTPAQVMEDWMNSDSHRANILDERWKEVGIAVRLGGDYAIYWVQEFGDPLEIPLVDIGG